MIERGVIFLHPGVFLSCVVEESGSVGVREES